MVQVLILQILSLLRDVSRIMGPAFLVSVAYLDPGNWATAIEAGSRFGYRLVWVVVASNLVAILLQTLSARLGICTGKHLAQVCRESYPPVVIWIVWATCEISIVALDLTMLLGTAVGLNLLLGWPLLPCILLTGLDVVLLLLLVPHKGAIKKSEALTVCLLAVVVACFLVDLMVSKPPVSKLVGGLLPTMGGEHLYTAVSLLGANVMPHSFYLHSALVSDQARLAAGSVKVSPTILSRLCFLNFCDIGCALAVALVVNVSVLLVSAATFHSRGITVETLQDAHNVMERTLSSNIAPHAFGMALLCAGQLSTFTGTISGQVVLQGFLNVHISTWARRLITRSAAIVPAAILQYVWGDRATYKFLLIAQVALALQLPVTLVPMIKATSSRAWMGSFRNSWMLAFCAWSALGVIFCANLMLLISQMVNGVEGQSPQPVEPLYGHDLEAAWLGLEPDGPVDLFLDDVLALAWNNPLRFAGMLLMVVAGAAFLALQLWMIVTPLPAPAGVRVKGGRAGLMPSMLCEHFELTGDVDDEEESPTLHPPLHQIRGSFSKSRRHGSGGIGGDGEEEEEVHESWYQGPPDSPRGHEQDEEQALPDVLPRHPTRSMGQHFGSLWDSGSFLQPPHGPHTLRHEGGWLPPGQHQHQQHHHHHHQQQQQQQQQSAPVGPWGETFEAVNPLHVQLQGSGAGAGAHVNAAGSTHRPTHSHVGQGGAAGGSQGLPSQGGLSQGLPSQGVPAAQQSHCVFGGELHPPQDTAGNDLVLGAMDVAGAQPEQLNQSGLCVQGGQQQELHQHHQDQHQQHQLQHQHQHQQQQQQQQAAAPDRHALMPHSVPHAAGSSGGGGGRAGLSRSARRQVAACLEDFFGQFYSAHGQYHCPPHVSGAQQAGTPLLCYHTNMSHLCTACAQALYLEVRNCLKALEILEAASPGLLPDPEHVMDFLTRHPLSPAPAATPALAWHKAAVACLRLGDPVGMARLCARLYTSKLDDSRLLASMPLDSASLAPLERSLAQTRGSSPPGIHSRPDPQHPLQHPSNSQHQHQLPQQGGRGGASAEGVSEGNTTEVSSAGGASGARGEGGGDDSCLPALLNPEPRRALLAQISRMIGFEQPPAMNQWCLVGPASFLSFGVWSLSLLVGLCQNEARPELWGRYAMVLNKQQGLLRDARLEVATPASSHASGAATPGSSVAGGSPGSSSTHATVGFPAAVGGHAGATTASQGGVAGGVGGGSSVDAYSGLEGGEHLVLGGGAGEADVRQQGVGASGGFVGSGGGGGATQPSLPAFMPLPPSAIHLDSRHLAELRLELARQLQVLEIALADRRGPPGTAAGEVAFPKGKEIMQSVIKRLRRRLGYAHGSGAGGGTFV